MTAIVGILCKDGAVFGADSSATLFAGAVRTIEQPTQKLHVIQDRVIVAGTGPIGFTQRFCGVIEKSLDAGLFKHPPLRLVTELSRDMLSDLAQTQITPERLAQLQYGALIAFSSGRDPFLCEFWPPFFQPELKTQRLWYCSMGSAQPITDPFLALMRDVFWHNSPPTVPDAVFAATWTLDHAISVNPGGVNGPIQMAVLEGTDKAQLCARVLDEPELEEHRQNIEGAKDALRKHRESQQPVSQSGAPDVPKP